LKKKYNKKREMVIHMKHELEEKYGKYGKYGKEMKVREGKKKK